MNEENEAFSFFVIPSGNFTSFCEPDEGDQDDGNSSDDGESKDSSSDGESSQGDKKSIIETDKGVRAFLHNTVRAATSKTEERLTALDGRLDKLTTLLEANAGKGANDDDAGNGGSSDSADDPADKDNIAMRRMEARLKASEDNSAKVLKQLSDEKVRSDIKDRDSQVISLASKAGALDPMEVLVLTKDSLRKDEKTGEWLYETKNEFGGDELVKIDKFLPMFLEQKPHLKKGVSRQGSGAGQGSSGSTSSRMVKGIEVSAKAMRKNPEWYRENRKEIHKVMQSDMVSYRRDAADDD